MGVLPSALAHNAFPFWVISIPSHCRSEVLRAIARWTLLPACFARVRSLSIWIKGSCRAPPTRSILPDRERRPDDDYDHHPDPRARKAVLTVIHLISIGPPCAARIPCIFFRPSPERRQMHPEFGSKATDRCIGPEASSPSAKDLRFATSAKLDRPFLVPVHPPIG